MRRERPGPEVRLTRRALLAAGAAALAGCAASAPEPVPLLAGADTCTFCRMTILDERLAAEYALGGRILKFDEAGCLRDWVLAHDQARSGRAWLRDHAGSGWMEAGAAVFVAGAVATPMSTNVAAFRSAEAAAALVRDRGGRVLPYAEILGREAAAGRRFPPGRAGEGRGGARAESP